VAFISGKAKARRAALDAEIQTDMGYEYQPSSAYDSTYGSAENVTAEAAPFEETPQDSETSAE